MSGHSKWANIKRKKEASDFKRAKVFTKLARGIIVAVQKGGSDPDTNPALRLAVEKARQANMPKGNIERAIARGLGKRGQSEEFQEARYEGYGPGGVAIIVDCLTDNRNRTSAEIRNIFTRFGGALGESGCAAYIFGDTLQKPSFTVPVQDPNDLKKLKGLLDALEHHEDVHEVYCNADISL